ncbi:MAG: cadmium-translocating P-type ATPase [Lactobacillales bacterium]|jgi:Cd2+/Zn2+-exporting ATPase|nr:cadmium-translocating P-type ATPase [Lactobacillales bacterium]
MEEKSERIQKIAMIIGAILFVAGLALELPELPRFTIFFISYLLIGGEVLMNAAKNIRRGEIFDENFLMSIATIGAFAIGEFPEGVAVMLFYQIGEAVQDFAVDKSRKSISELMDIRPDFATLKDGGQVAPDEVQIGDVILVKPGEKIPLDGTITDGYSTLDTSALTGESLPREVEPGAQVLSGSINQSGLLTITVTQTFKESTVSKILELVENASSKKSPTEKFITKFSRIYTPVVVFAALAIAVLPPLLTGADFSEWIKRALVFLVVSCPCALVISIPLSFFGGIGGASKQGILIKGSNFLDALNRVDTVVFDKTGTLTSGSFAVTKTVGKSPLLEVAAYAESHSSHPIARSIIKAYGEKIDETRISEYEEIAGQGVRVKFDGQEVLAGNAKLMAMRGIDFTPSNEIGTTVYIAASGEFIGHLVIADEIKKDSKQAIESLKKLGINNIVMLTGDNKEVGDAVGRELGITDVKTELLPQQKVEQLELLESTGSVLFVGDGINDAPVLARSTVGVAMGGVGSDAAIEAADIVLMTDEPSKIITAIKIARKTRKIVMENIIFALSVKAIILVLGALGIATIWAAVFGDVGVALLAILNALRAMRVKN